MSNEITPFEQIRRTNTAGNEFCPRRDLARVIGYADYRNFEAVIEKARTACFNNGHRVEDHFVDITEMVEIGRGAQRPLGSNMTVHLSPTESIKRLESKNKRALATKKAD